jgi:metabotropic X receptor
MVQFKKNFSIVYGALLTKTNRIARIFDASKKSAKRPNFISPKSQLIICSGLILVQVMINVIWMLVSPPEAIHHHPTREDNLLVCKVSKKLAYCKFLSYAWDF